jgi:tyrosyl-tRNA synthetase
MKLYDDLVWRGLIKDITSPELEEKLNNESLTFYIGTDPTADSLHLGHLSSFLISKRLKEAGHNPILLVGGATGMIGDPRPTSERNILAKDELNKNIAGLTEQVKNLFGFQVVNNYDWCKNINFLDFLRDYGKYFNVNYMLDKDIIRRRLETGITYTEFSYMIIQALDFMYLNETFNCTLEVAGSDQWGNITAGVDLIKKKTGKTVYGFTMPLVTTKAGVKFGKSEGNAIWLDKNKTSVYEMYQYLINTEDEKVIEYLKIFTFLSKEEIEKLETSTNNEPHLRLAQDTLAKEVITFVHSKEDYFKAKEISENLFKENFCELKLNDILVSFKDVPHFTFNEFLPILDFLVTNEVCSSKREAKEFIVSKALKINGNVIDDENLIVDKNLLLYDKLLIIRKGKKKYFVAEYKN